MKIQIIDADQAPSRPASDNPTRRAATELVQALTPGKVAAVTPGAKQSIRGTKSIITRAGTREGRPVRTWDHRGTVYARLRDE